MLSFTSKASTLLSLQNNNHLFIPPFIYFTIDLWHSNLNNVLFKISDFFSRFSDTTSASPTQQQVRKVAIRSSCLREDNTVNSSAGAFLSLLNIDINDTDALTDAINRVIASYGEASPDDQVLVQEMIENVVVTGVIMTRVLADGTPYYVINYDDESGRTDTITGGTKISKTVFVYRDVKEDVFESPRLKEFVKLAKKLEEICESDSLDIEFCQDSDGVVHLLQVRPMCVQQHWEEEHDAICSYIDQIAQFVERKTGTRSELFGKRSILGVMPDWNPAEMIGVIPKPLATSLYRNLITRYVWSAARMQMGYRSMPSCELMLQIVGRPYIDVRASFNSFLPEGLDPITCEALVSAWLERLGAKPQLHDKIEFEIAITCLDFCFDTHFQERYGDLLPTKRLSDFKNCLLRLTRNCLDPQGSLYRAYDAIAELRNKQAGRALVSVQEPLSFSSIPELLFECRKYGTLPFSILARHAFIAESLLRTAVERGALKAESVAGFKRTIETISGEMSREFREICLGRRDSVGFMHKYGHLRPGSYDITSPRYMDRVGLFAKGSLLETREKAEWKLTDQERRDLSSLLRESGLGVDVDNLLTYARRAIAGRELAKFTFTRNLSDVLELLALWGERLGFDREDVSFLDIERILDRMTSCLTIAPKEYFADLIAENKQLYAQGSKLKLGYLIRSVRDVFVVPQHRAAPNFVGSGRVEGQYVELSAESSCTADLQGKIICIENADPGFDWIFTRNIAALITKFGGTNSHMAIRCAEYGLPAAIGVGEQLYGQLTKSSGILLDPATSTLKESDQLF